MPSTLYTLARDLLADETKALLDEFIEWLSSDSDVAFPWHETGRRLADNLMSEAHLVGSGDYGSPQEMLQFLTTCVERFKLASTDQECRIAFNVACKEFFLRGLVIGTEIVPDNLGRVHTMS